MRRKGLASLLLLGTGSLLGGCGSRPVILNPAGPVAATELRLIETVSIAMGAVILLVFALFAVAVWRFRDRPGNTAPYSPEWAGSRLLEAIWFLIPVAIVAVIAVPTVRQTYALAHLPKVRDPLVVDVTSFEWKWLFEYPAQHIATVGYVKVRSGVPVLYELTADSPMNTFWVPALGGMEYTMPGRILPLWLQADKPGIYQGRSANFSGAGFVDMRFSVQAVSAAQFSAWVRRVRRTRPPLTMAGYQNLLKPGTTARLTYSTYPLDTFPRMSHGFTLKGGMYIMATTSNGAAAPLAATPGARSKGRSA